MITEFLWLTLLTLKEDDREALRNKFDEWLKCFLPKLKRESTRTAKCRLLASVERHEFGNTLNAIKWEFCRFVGNKGIIFDKDKDQLEEFEATSFQKKILSENPDLLNVLIGRSEIKEENGKWKLFDGLKETIISEGAKAIVFCQKFGEEEFAVRVQIFDPFLFTTMFSANQIKWKTHLISDFGTAKHYDYEKKDDASVVPIHENIVRNYANFELFDVGDEKEGDCLGWITVMERCEGDLQKELKKENLNFDERKKIATGIEAGFQYLESIGIRHCDRKLSNFLLIGDQVKICDFGLVDERSWRRSYRQLGYARSGSKYKDQNALFSGTPGFAAQDQLGAYGMTKNDYILYLFCDWKTSWSLKYRPIDEKEQKEIDKIVESCGVQDLKHEKHVPRDVVNYIKKIISLPNASGSFCFDDPYLTKSLNMSNIKHQMTKCVNLTMQNLTKNILDQKSSNLCVPISVTALLRFAIKNDLAFIDKYFVYSSEKILTTLTMIVYPRSLAGLNLNPKNEEKDYQTNDVETLLQRICEKTYLMESGWEIIREQAFNARPLESTCEFKDVLLNENFLFTRPLTVTGVFLLPDDTVFFHQMVLDHVDDLTDEYVLQNSSFDYGGAVLRIPKTREYYVNEFMMLNNNPGPGEFKYYGKKGEFMWLVNEDFDSTETHRPMMQNTWYLLPQAYSLTLVPKLTVSPPVQEKTQIPTQIGKKRKIV